MFDYDERVIERVSWILVPDLLWLVNGCSRVSKTNTHFCFSLLSVDSDGIVFPSTGIDITFLSERSAHLTLQNSFDGRA